MPNQLSLIVDLHTHLFNARCLPLAGIFANAMKTDAGKSPLARWLAKLVYRLTEAEYTPPQEFLETMDPADFYIDQLSKLAAHELTLPLHENMEPQALGLAPLQRRKEIVQSDIYEYIRGLESELVQDDAAPVPGPVPENMLFEMNRLDLHEWAKKTVAKALHTLQNLADKGDKIGDEIDNYAQFIFSMLSAEEHMAHTLIERYGDGLPKMQFVHHMMDMQMAYTTKDGTTTAEMVAPKYSFYDTQLTRMQDIARHFDGQILGFSAFDPRRDNWEEIVTASIKMGFKGFKFYTAMGYLPIGNSDPTVEQRVLDFFRLCIKEDIPVFTHCTPSGFQTRFKQGLNADPLNWEKLLNSHDGEFENLRLCFGHAGGGSATNQGHHSPGWTATDEEWESDKNYAFTVARLCQSYKNVYCEFAYITDLMESAEPAKKAARLLANLLRVLKTDGPGKCYNFADKIAYGSDWNMPSMVDHPRKYLNVFLDLFEDPRLLDYRERFFWRNAYSFLNLH